MTTYVVLLRGINVGGKNKLSMAALKQCLDGLGYTNVSTYINSGNIVLDSKMGAKAIAAELEAKVPKAFKLDSALIKVLALPKAAFKAMIASRPNGFGEEPGKYHSDALFLFDDIDGKETLAAFTPREGVDAVSLGKGVIFHQRLSAQRTKTRLNQFMATRFYKSLTMRNWATTMKLLEMVGG